MKKQWGINVLLTLVFFMVFLFFFKKPKMLFSYYLVKVENGKALSYTPTYKKYQSTEKSDYSLGYATFHNSFGEIKKHEVNDSGKTILETETVKIVLSEILPVRTLSNFDNKDISNGGMIGKSKDNVAVLEEIQPQSGSKYSKMREKYTELSNWEEFNRDIFFTKPKSLFELLSLANEDFDYYLFLVNEKVSAIKHGKYEYIFFETQTLYGRLDIKKQHADETAPKIVANICDTSSNKWQVVHFYSDQLSLAEIKTFLATFKYKEI